MKNSFDVLKEMGEKNLDINLAPTRNIIEVKIEGNNGKVVIGVPRSMAQRLIDEEEFYGGLILANKKQFDEIAKGCNSYVKNGVVHGCTCGKCF